MNPYQLLTNDEMTILKAYYTRESDKAWTSEKKKVVAKILGKLREKGFAIDGLYPSGSLRFSVTNKSVLELAMELPEEQFRAFRDGRLKLIDGQWREVVRGEA